MNPTRYGTSSPAGAWPASWANYGRPRVAVILQGSISKPEEANGAFTPRRSSPRHLLGGPRAAVCFGKAAGMAIGVVGARACARSASRRSCTKRRHDHPPSSWRPMGLLLPHRQLSSSLRQVGRVPRRPMRIISAPRNQENAAVIRPRPRAPHDATATTVGAGAKPPTAGDARASVRAAAGSSPAVSPSAAGGIPARASMDMPSTLGFSRALPMLASAGRSPRRQSGRGIFEYACRSWRSGPPAKNR